MRAAQWLLIPVLAGVVVLAGCRAEPVEPTPSPTASRTAPAPSPTPSSEPSPTETASADDIVLPSACEDIYSDAMLAALNAQNPPLNDPGVTMHSTQNAGLLETLNSGIPTLRCSWGQPSEFGLATNVSIVDAAQSAAVLSALQGAGFGCEQLSGGTVCRIEQKTIDQDDNQVTLAETHYLRGNGWVSTASINFAPTGYTEDIVATLWD